MPAPHPAPLPPRDCSAREAGDTPASRFRALHAGDLFVMPNPWDAGTARLLAERGFPALATSSAALAWTLGRPDNSTVTRAEAIAHARLLHEATGLPVNGDFESGYGETPDEVADTIRAAIEAGVAGCSVEDLARDRPEPLFDLKLAAARIEAARLEIDQAGSAFVLTGRTEVFFTDHPDPLGEAIRRLKAFVDAGAHVVYAPAVTHEDDIAAIVEAVPVPVNVLGGLGGASSDLDLLRRLGVRRVSIGSGLAKAALGAFLRTADALQDGRFDYAGSATSATLNGAFAGQNGGAR